ncbi:perlucin-like protein [Teleopsis dalmanni]|uniref:perlucin-like protein n=1 Tax=Teleopsis dalmanni TaxID=139649 RepID=UPI0018CE730D|nr:perlucin-like protein [Teleopsis dalmanni]
MYQLCTFALVTFCLVFGVHGALEPVEVANKTYTIKTTTKQSWFKAEQLCNLDGLTLATITSADDNDNLSDALDTAGVSSGEFWIGGTDNALTGDWYWLGSGVPVVYNEWIKGKPGNANKNDHCMSLVDYSWTVSNCEKKLFYICQNQC